MFLGVEFQVSSLDFRVSIFGFLMGGLVDATGIEPVILACKASVIPFNYAPARERRLTRSNLAWPPKPVKMVFGRATCTPQFGL